MFLFLWRITVQQNAKHFSDQLNKCLDDIDVPGDARDRDRIIILSKMLDISKQQARSLLEGHIYPDKILLERIAHEFETDIRVFENTTSNKK
jgi:hypothetical protein